MDWFSGQRPATAMLNLSTATRIFVALEPVDMRKSFNGLYARVQSVLREEPTSGHWFVFTNKLRNRLKILFWDGSGLWVCAKRLEKGTFGWPNGEGASRCLRAEELTLLIHGIESTSRRQWHRV
jgi:transposase